jgi:hypothetical protein
MRLLMGRRPTGYGKVCDGVHREHGTNAATAALLASWEGSEIAGAARRAAVATGKAEPALVKAMGVDPELVFTIGEGRDEGDSAVLPFTVWYRRREPTFR